MHKAFRIGLAAYALAGGGAIASAQEQVEAGAQLYEEHCMGCHGEKLKAPGTSFDLRKLTAEERPRFDKFVLDGKGQMPPWRGTLNETELDQLWAYIARTRIEARRATADMPPTHFDSVVRAYSALTISSVIFLASPNSIMVLSR